MINGVLAVSVEPLAVLMDRYHHRCLGRRLFAAFPHDGYSMAADPDSFEDGCRSDDGSILSGDASDDSDPEEVQSLLATIQVQGTRTEQRVHNIAGNGPAAVSSYLATEYSP
jgi:hypothetical protein